LLVEITAPELDHQITQAKATLAQNQATLQQTQASRELADVTNARDSRLVKQGWLTLQQGDNDRLTLQAQQAAVGVAQSNIAAQEAQIRVLEQEKAYQRVIAPFDGVITQRNIDNGSLVTAGSTFMFTLMHPDVIRTQVFVPQDEAFGLGPGVDAVIRVPEIPNRSFPGKVTRIASALQPGSRTLLTEIDVPNPDGALSPGIYCTVELYIPRKTPSMIVPADAVVFDRNGLHVAVVENGIAHLQKITIARDFGTEVEVHDGVKPDDQVILNPMINLMDGSQVAVSVNPEDGYGKHEPGLIQRVPKRTLQGSGEVKKGMQFQARTADGMRLFTVTGVMGDMVTLDGNHPLADKTLHFDVQVVGVREATTEELEHGHVHGAGGHHH